MLQSIKCACGHVFPVAEGSEGYLVPCPACGQQLTVPAPEPAELMYAAPAQGQVVVTPRAIEILRRTIVWAKTMSILMFVGDGFCVLAGIIVFAAGMLAPGRDSLPPAFGLVYLAMAAVNLPAAIFLLRFAARTKTFVGYRHEQKLEEALDFQRSFWKYTAILSLVIVGLYLLLIPVAIMAAISRH